MKIFRIAIVALLGLTYALYVGGSDATVSGTTTVTGTFTPPSGGGSPSYVYSVGQTVSPTGSDSNINKVDFALLGKITLPSAGTVTKLGIWLNFVNASTPIKLALFDSSRVVVGSSVSGTITSGDGQWHDIASSITVPSSGTYYVGISTDGPYDGSIVTIVDGGGASGDAYLTFDSGMYAAFPSLTGLSANSGNFAFRVELTP